MPPQSYKRALSPSEPSGSAETTCPRRDLLPLDQLWALKIQDEQLVESGEDQDSLLGTLEKITDGADAILASFPEDAYDDEGSSTRMRWRKGWTTSNAST